jgi:GNAT superfamily N-acetyltransferase
VEEKKGYFAMLAIDPAHQKKGIYMKTLHDQKGIAKIVINFLETYAAKLGCVVMEIDVVNIRTQLHKFYNALGYIQTTTKPYVLEGAFEEQVQDFVMIIFQKPLVNAENT